MTMFRRKGKEKPAGSGLALELPILGNGADTELLRKLDMEIRSCPTCSYSIANPMNDRCPRCFTLVPLSEHTNCGECSHQGNCTYGGDQQQG
ncbi:MAG: hypothetical protein ABI876_01775 [Bacteroidota bacterium]